jgi:hypothetical protein
MYKDNITIEDIKEIEVKLNALLTDEQRESVLREYNAIIGDRAESWDELIEILIVKQSLIQILKDKNK